MKNYPDQAKTNDTTLEDEYEMQRLDALPPQLRDLAALHAIDQFEAVMPYLQRFQPPSGEEHVHA